MPGLCTMVLLTTYVLNDIYYKSQYCICLPPYVQGVLYEVLPSSTPRRIGILMTWRDLTIYDPCYSRGYEHCVYP